VVTERFRSGDLGPEEALHLFNELLPLATPDSVYAFNQLLTVIVNAPASSSVHDGPALAISCFNRMARASTTKVAPDLCTYSILISCGCRVGRLDLAFSSLALVIKTGWRMNARAFTHLLSALCVENRIDDAMDIVLTRMLELGCTPDCKCNQALSGFWVN
jgi:pentatricopeptide repeat protein